MDAVPGHNCLQIKYPQCSFTCTTGIALRLAHNPTTRYQHTITITSVNQRGSPLFMTNVTYLLGLFCFLAPQSLAELSIVPTIGQLADCAYHRDSFIPTIQVNCRLQRVHSIYSNQGAIIFGVWKERLLPLGMASPSSFTPKVIAPLKPGCD